MTKSFENEGGLYPTLSNFEYYSSNVGLINLQDCNIFRDLA